ncbi:transcriptional regulator [Burkholderia pseudomallei]|uniref:transcriptional regulator n=1 Tax=Burkholderia pseudomallei TaxID=28450 RepID=UPI000A4561B0|nr:transcriptional regulator [Burkholderia pseudomallei]
MLGRCRFNPGRRAAGSAARCRAKVDPRASRGHAIERRANVVREKAGKPRTQPQKEPQKCRKTSGQARDEALPGFFLCAFRDEAARPFDSRRAPPRAPRLAVCRAIAIQCGAGA